MRAGARFVACEEAGAAIRCASRRTGGRPGDGTDIPGPPVSRPGCRRAPRARADRGYLPVPTGSTVMAGPPSVTGTLTPARRTVEWVSFGGVTTSWVKVTPEPPELFGG